MPQINLSLHVYLVDDDTAILDSLSFMLSQFNYNITAFSSGEQFLEEVSLEQAGCVILDSRMPIITGQEVQRKLLKADSPLGIIFLTGHGDMPMAVDAFRKGACDFFQKPVLGTALAQAINEAFIYSQQRFNEKILIKRILTLSPRELQILQLMTQGKTNKQISATLFLSLRTIEVHRAKVMTKLEVHNIAELVKFDQI